VTRPRARKSFHVVLAVLPFVLAALLVEAAGQIVLFFRPSYQVLFLQPDRALGWKQVPGMQWTWTGIGWYAADFSVGIHTNSRGFRDREREPAKPDGVVRIALLGDSFVEALQVPLEKTAGQLLEARLNAARDDSKPRYEVLNFGISNYSVGQSMLAYENAAREFAPDYVFILVAFMERSVMKFDLGQFDATAGKRMWVRPTFRLQDDRLVREPAADFEEFVLIQRNLIENELGGRRSRRRVGSFVVYQLKQFGLWPVGKAPAPSGGLRMEPIDVEETIPVNLRILEDLGSEVQAAGGRFVAVDLSGYASAPKTLPSVLAMHCIEHNFGYVPLGRRLLAARRNGTKINWAHDGHLNKAGNEVFAAAMYDWLRRNGAQ
jgi:hypothetical protein